ncbi:hypothetical protein B9Z55_015189 [Caenorhabditis nigoni]|uniref:EF-hand domain-containing protein n=1 Tax=Caenorhabditis nigoni TaxID=1611254 RepID=A0A2G5U9V6_9PELO|nr:hypothetical protein B9Z55_015189 [Caenorhabditis nigoni]
MGQSMGRYGSMTGRGKWDYRNMGIWYMGYIEMWVQTSRLKNALKFKISIPNQPISRIMKETDSEMIREAFKIFDRDGNGVITANEFKLFMINMGMCFDECEVEEMMNEVDCDGNGEIDYEEFVKIFS